MVKSYRDQILLRKVFLNILLNYLSPTNFLVVYISQDLDKLVSKSQKQIYSRYLNRNRNKKYLKIRNVA